MLKTHKAIAKIIVSYVLPPILPVLAAVIILLQQIYYPDADVAVVFNIMLLSMSLIEFLPLAINRQDRQPCLLVCNIALLLEAFLYNVFLVGIPSPLENLAAFINSICGAWVVVACLEICLFIVPMLFARYREGEDGYRSAEDTLSRQNPPSEDDTEKDPDGSENPSPKLSRPSFKSKRKAANGSAQIMSPKVLSLIIIVAILVLPCFDLTVFSPWFERIKELTNTVYGSELGSANELLTFILYVVMMVAIAMMLWVIYWVIYFTTEEILRKPESIRGVLAEYSAPASVFIVALVVIYAVNNTEQNDQFSFDTFSEIVELMILIIVGIIILLALFEVLKLVIEQCLKKGTLLKTAMDLVFVLVVQYTTNFIMGILKVFALKDVIESILLFFMPDLNVEIGAKVDRVLNEALEIEIAKLERVLFENNKAELKGKAAGRVQPGMKTTNPIRRRESDEK